MLQQAKMTQIIRSVERLRPMPTNVSRILKALDDPFTTAQMVTDLIGLDQAIAAMVLQYANSAAMGYGSVCSSLLVAVMRLGFKRVKTILIGAAATGSINSSLSGYRLGAGVLWNHSIATASAALWISRSLGYPDPEEAYVAGLLHDMGKLLLDQYVQVDYHNIIDMMNQYGLLLWQAEQKMFGIDHAGVGGLMAQKWNFPSVLIEAIRYHHLPSMAMEYARLAAITNIANAVATRDEHGLNDPHGKVIHPESPVILKLNEAGLDRIVKGVEAYLQIENTANPDQKK